jgi:hypothetical protein
MGLEGGSPIYREGEANSVESLVSELRAITLKNSELEAALQLATKKLSLREEFDSTIGESISQALHAAFEVKSGVERQAKALLDRVEKERLDLQGQIRALQAELRELEQEKLDLLNETSAIRARLRAFHMETEGLIGERMAALDQALGAPSAMEVPLSPPARLSPAPEPITGERPLEAEAVTSEPQPETVTGPVAADTGAGHHCELVAAPLHDFATLVNLEIALLATTGVKGLYVRSFEQGVATIALTLASAADQGKLLQQLGDIAEFGLTVINASQGRIEVQVQS